MPKTYATLANEKNAQVVKKAHTQNIPYFTVEPSDIAKFITMSAIDAIVTTKPRLIASRM